MPVLSIDFYIMTALIVSVVVQLWYYLVVFSRLGKLNSTGNTQSPGNSVSIVICAKNEELNLSENLPIILEQNYPDFEVVVVNDSSSDKTAAILSGLQKKYENLKVVSISPSAVEHGGKKAALTTGIASTNHEILLLTDADCSPVGPDWISGMMGNFTEGRDIVLGYSPFKKEKGMLNLLQRYDVFYTALQYLSFALKGIPYMGVGRNLAYRKSLFIENKGFSSHCHIISGDDDLFISEVANDQNIVVEIGSDSKTFSQAPENLAKWFHQKRRHYTTGGHYTFEQKVMLAGFHVSLMAFHVSIFTLLFSSGASTLLVALILMKYSTQFLVLKKCTDKLGEIDLLLFSPILELFISVFNFFAALSNLFFKRPEWN
ncbi:MAG TPA: glycosyltransferase [Flavobacteriales bacterium]|nr:glycosyltransferase [Flavobacteriales bacterium]